VYTANPFITVGPIPPTGAAVATEFYNDHLGTLSALVAPELSQAFLQYTVAAKPDGTIELAGTLQNTAELDFGPTAIDAILPTIGADGFPKDEFFYDSGSPFTLTSPQGMISGVLRVRHIVP